MCPVCGTPLGLATEAPQAQRERAYIQRLIDRLPLEGPDQAGARGAVRRRACWRCRATRATTTSATCSSTWYPRSAILLAAGGIAFARAALARRGGRDAAAAAPGARPERRAARRRHGALRPVIAQETVDTTVVAAFAVGFISFVSPCVLPLVPGYLSTISGVSFADIQEGRAAARCSGPALLFCLAFTAMFVALGMTATGLGQTLQDNRAAAAADLGHHHRCSASCSSRCCSSPSSTASGAPSS